MGLVGVVVGVIVVGGDGCRGVGGGGGGGGGERERFSGITFSDLGGTGVGSSVEGSIPAVGDGLLLADSMSVDSPSWLPLT